MIEEKGFAPQLRSVPAEQKKPDLHACVTIFQDPTHRNGCRIELLYHGRETSPRGDRQGFYSLIVDDVYREGDLTLCLYESDLRHGIQTLLERLEATTGKEAERIDG